jgi:hypothetical protein
MLDKEQTYDLSELSTEQAVEIASKGSPLKSLLRLEEETELLRKALNEKDPSAQHTLSEYYYRVTGLSDRYPLATRKNSRWLAEQAANQNYLPAKFSVTYFDIEDSDPSGNAIPTKKLAETVKNIAEDGYYDASFIYGQWLIEGHGIEQDIESGIEMWKNSVQQSSERPHKEQTQHLNILIAHMEIYTIPAIHSLEDKLAISASTFYPVLDILLTKADLYELISHDGETARTFQKLIGQSISETAQSFPDRKHG